MKLGDYNGYLYTYDKHQQELYQKQHQELDTPETKLDLKIEGM